MRKSICLFVLLVLVSITYGQPGKDGIKIVAGNIIVNKYSPVTSNLTSGTTSITVVSQLTLLGLCPGDLIMVYQAQGATISNNNTINYGNVTSYNNAGFYEYVYVNGVSGNIIFLASGLVNNYTANGMTQVIKVPQYTSLTLNAGTSLVSKLWKDTIVSAIRYRFGGIIAVHASSILNNGTINANGAGFRGGKLDIVNQAAYTSSLSNYVSANNYEGGEKGEGIAGYQPEYDVLSGRYGRGSPANGGGGGNAWNAGGGGGANANNGNVWTGQGVMIVDPFNPLAAWQLDPAFIANGNALTNSSGGGRGGYSVGYINQNATTTGPNDPSWGLDSRSEMGGLGGRPLSNINYSNRIYFGGGGGAGDENNANSSNGGNGGGLIYLIATNSISGNGMISANGDNGGNTIGAGYDAPSGAGAGGSIVILTPVIASTQTVTAKGGNGGNQFISNSEFEGPGGGGGGGFVAISSGAVTPSVSGGIGGNTNSSSLTEFPDNGATAGANGLSVIATYSFIPYNASAFLNITSNSPLCAGATLNLNASFISGASYSWTGPNTFTAITQNTSIINVQTTASGVYTVMVNFAGCPPISNTHTVSVTNGSTLAVTGTTAVCSGEPATLNVSGAANYTWNPGNNNGSSITVNPTSTTVYTVTGTVGLCASSATITVNVKPSPIITSQASPAFICSGSSAILSANGALTYTWEPGNLNTATINVLPSATTLYTISGTNAQGCVSASTLMVTVNPNPIITINPASPTVCLGGSTTLTATGALNYTWMPGNLTGNNIVTVNTTSLTTYTVTGQTGGCFAVSTVSLLAIDCAGFVFGVTKAAGKPVLINNTFYNVSFTVTAVNASTLNIINVALNENLLAAFPSPSNFSVVSQPVITSQNSSLNINPLFDGVSQISLTSPSTSTLLANKRDTIVFTVRIDPKGYFGPFKNSVIGIANFQNGISIIDSSNNGFAWDPDLDGDPTNNDTVTIINLPIIDLFIPDGFSPDGDGKNDVFFIKGLNGRRVKLTIFNRWGNKVYEKSEYDNSWNGLVNTSGLVLGNNKVPASTYYYIIEFLDGEKETRTGFVVVQY